MAKCKGPRGVRGNVECEKGTWLEPEELCYPGGGMRRRCRAMCPDGKLRIVICGIPDTYFSVPARAKIKGKSMRGYVYIQRDGAYHFRPYDNQPGTTRDAGE